MDFSSHLRGNALALLLSASATGAWGSMVYVSQGLPIGSIYGNNASMQTYASSFDAASALGTVNLAGDYVINSARAYFAWTDNPNDPFSMTSSSALSNVYGSYGYSYTGPDYTNYYTRSVTGTKTEQYATPGESATVTLGSKAISSSSTPLATTAISSNSVSYTQTDSGSHGYWQESGYTHHYSCGFLHLFTCSRWVDTSHPVYGQMYVSNHTDTTASYRNDYTGSFSLDIDLSTLGADALADLNDDGILGFSMQMTGTAVLNQAYLILDVAPKALPVDVPEPGVLALLSLAFAGLAASARKRKV